MHITTKITHRTDAATFDAVAEAGRAAWHRCSTLSYYSESPNHMTRRFLTPPMKQVHATVSDWMAQAGLTVRYDGMGNIIGHRPPPYPEAPIYAIGSHLDTVPRGGIYDGILGTVGAIAVADLLKNKDLPFGLEIVGFSEEEGIRFHFPFLGSHCYAGTLTADMLELRDADGVSVADAVIQYGLYPDSALKERSAPKNLAGFFEMHIEQGRFLEVANQPVGVVTTIAAQKRLQCRVLGEARHAGSTPMPVRRDALQAAAEMIAQTEKIAADFGELVMTTGFIEVTPNAPNCIAGSVDFNFDVRHPRDSVLDVALKRLLDGCREIAMRRGVQFEVLAERGQAAVPMDDRLQNIAHHAIADAGMDAMSLVSWAGHDVMIMSQVCPVALLLLRCKEGISHHPDEFISEEDTIAGVYTMYQCLENLALTMNRSH